MLEERREILGLGVRGLWLAANAGGSGRGGGSGSGLGAQAVDNRENGQGGQ